MTLTGPRRLLPLGLSLLAVLPLMVLKPVSQPAAAAQAKRDPVVYAASGTTLQVVDAVTGQTGQPIEFHRAVASLALTPDGRFIVAGLGSIDAVNDLVSYDVGDSTAAGIVTDLPVKLIGLSAAATSPDGSKAFLIASEQILQVSIQPDGGLTDPVDLVTPNQRLTDLAVSPDGQSLYVVSDQGLLRYGLPLQTGEAPETVLPGNGLGRIVISPDGATAYLIDYVPCGLKIYVCLPVGGVETVRLSDASSGTIALPRPHDTPPQPNGITLAVSPTGAESLWVADPANFDVAEIPLGGATPTATKVVTALQPLAVAATPDGRSVEVTTLQGMGAANDATDRWACGPCGSFSGPLAVAPDQRPQAAFAAVPGTAGSATSFDASASTVATGVIARYAWSFGDGSSQSTATPAGSHVYARPGTYAVSVTETDEAGTSVALSPPSTVFTGHTMSRRGGPPAQITQRVTIPAVPDATPTTPGGGPGTTSPSAGPNTGPTDIPAPGKPQPPGQAGAPRLLLEPSVGPPGTVVEVSGSGFASNAQVPLVWRPGIGALTVTTNAEGGFRDQMLVLPRDQLGPRILVAQGSAASAAFLVVPVTVEPAGASVQLLFRR